MRNCLVHSKKSSDERLLMLKTGVLLVFLLFLFTSCENKQLMRVIIDTDANNEVDDQFALAYLFFSGDYFDVEGVTVNATGGGGEIENHYLEAKRIMQLCGVYEKVPLFKGANSGFEEIKGQIDAPDFDGHAAVDFIIERALAKKKGKLVLLPIGKLTNIALALMKEPAIASRIHVFWLGGNYPDPREYNLLHDIPALNYLLNMDVPFDMVTVRYNKPSGTDAVRVSKAEILRRMPGLGPQASSPIAGRHEGAFSNFGDYAVNLFENYAMKGDPPGRPLYDMAAVAVLKNPLWADSKTIPAPDYVEKEWVDRPGNPREITFWENFDIYGIVNDFFLTMENPVLIKTN